MCVCVRAFVCVCVCVCVCVYVCWFLYHDVFSAKRYSYAGGRHFHCIGFLYPDLSFLGGERYQPSAKKREGGTLYLQTFNPVSEFSGGFRKTHGFTYATHTRTHTLTRARAPRVPGAHACTHISCMHVCTHTKF